MTTNTIKKHPFRILITGKNSAVGTHVEKWLCQWPQVYKVDTVDVITDQWKTKDFSEYNIVFHVAGIAHVSLNRKLEPLFFSVNRDLTISVATKAKREGVSQFIFMSSAIVYGDSSRINRSGAISVHSVPSPTNFYGRSKLEAENGIKKLEDENFKVAILRCPAIYGKNMKSNYNRLSKYAQKALIFPNIENYRSMLYIDNLSEFVRLLITNQDRGTFHPQNDGLFCISSLVQRIGVLHGRKILLTKLFNPIIRLLALIYKRINKVFGNFCFEDTLSMYHTNYIVVSNNESIEIMEK